MKPLVYAALGGALVTQCPEGSDRQITDLTTKINNVCDEIAFSIYKVNSI